MCILRQFLGLVHVLRNSKAVSFQQAKQQIEVVTEGEALAAFDEDSFNGFLSCLLGVKTESLYGGGANFLFADGSVHFLSYAATPVMPALASRQGNDIADWDE